jgi:hypothetical protein
VQKSLLFENCADFLGCIFPGGAGESWHAGCKVLTSHGGTLADFRQFRPQHAEKNVMAQEKFAVVYGNNALDTKLEAARLMSEALTRPEDADALIAMAMMLFDSVNTAQERRA